MYKGHSFKAYVTREQCSSDSSKATTPAALTAADISRSVSEESST